MLKQAQYINPVLNALKGLGGFGRPSQVYDAVIKNIGLEDSGTLGKVHKSGARKIERDIDFARLFLSRTGYIDPNKWGIWTLTEKGRTSSDLSDEAIRELVRTAQRQNKRIPECGDDASEENEEELVVEELNYKAQLLAIVRELPPTGFEQLCQKLLQELDFESVEITGRPNDGGIDGIGVLKVNDLIAFKVLFQCKRYTGAVSASEIRDFRGAMQGKVERGIFLTTGTFTKEALKESIRDGALPIEMVDGKRLVGLFEKLELGLVPRTTYDVASSFFEQFRTHD